MNNSHMCLQKISEYNPCLISITSPVHSHHKSFNLKHIDLDSWVSWTNSHILSRILKRQSQSEFSSNESSIVNITHTHMGNQDKAMHHINKRLFRKWVLSSIGRARLDPLLKRTGENVHLLNTMEHVFTFETHNLVTLAIEGEIVPGSVFHANVVRCSRSLAKRAVYMHGYFNCTTVYVCILSDFYFKLVFDRISRP